MTTYNTMNPVPSADARDRFDNSQVFDEYVTGTDLQTPDRMGVMRKTLTGLENDFNNFLIQSGFEPVHLVYVDGSTLQIDRPTQLIDRAGSVYRVKMPASFPVELTGTWATDEGALVEVLNDQLRLDLANGTSFLVDADVVGTRLAPSSQDSTVDKILKRNIPRNVFDYMTEAEIADVLSLSPVLDHTVAIQNALNNNVVVELPPFTFRTTATLTMGKFGHTLICNSGNGSKAYGGGAVIKGQSSTTPIVTVTKPTTYFSGIIFWGLSSDTEKGEDVTQTGIRLVGDAQKDLDARIHNCGFIYLTSGVVANGTNVEVDSTIFSNCRYGFETSAAAGWENRGFTFAPTCRFHSIGKAGSASAGVKLWPTHNVRDVTIAGLVDDTTTAVNGIASGLTIELLVVRARGTGLVLDATGHGQPAQARVVSVRGYDYYATDATNTTMANAGITTTGLMRLTLSDITINGCGGHGIIQQVAGAILNNVHVSDAGQFANNTYDGVFLSGAGSFLSGVSTSQDAQGFAPTNKARFGINLQATCYVGSISPGLNTATAPLNTIPSVTVYGEIPNAVGPARTVSWGSAPPTSGTRAIGDVHWNTGGVVAGEAGSQYIISGWKCTAAGNPGTWVAMRTLTGT